MEEVEDVMSQAVKLLGAVASLTPPWKIVAPEEKKVRNSPYNSGQPRIRPDGI